MLLLSKVEQITCPEQQITSFCCGNGRFAWTQFDSIANGRLGLDSGRVKLKTIKIGIRIVPA